MVEGIVVKPVRASGTRIDGNGVEREEPLVTQFAARAAPDANSRSISAKWRATRAVTQESPRGREAMGLEMKRGMTGKSRTIGGKPPLRRKLAPPVRWDGVGRNRHLTPAG